MPAIISFTDKRLAALFSGNAKPNNAFETKVVQRLKVLHEVRLLRDLPKYYWLKRWPNVPNGWAIEVSGNRRISFVLENGTIKKVAYWSH